MAAKKQEAENNGRHSQNQKADKCRQEKKKLKIKVSVINVKISMIGKSQKKNHNYL